MELDLVTRRLELLERRCRRWRWAGIAFALMFGTPVLAAVIAILSSRGANQPRKYLVRDDQGRIRAALDCRPDGSPRLLFFGTGDQARVEIGVQGDETPSLSLFDASGKARLSMEVTQDGPLLNLRDADGKPRLMMMTLSDGSPGIGLHDEAGKMRGFLVAESKGASKLVFKDPDEKDRMMIGVTGDGTPALGLLDKSGAVRFDVHLDEKGHPVTSQAQP